MSDRNEEEEAWFSSVQDLHSAKVADAELGVAQLIADRSQEAFSEIERLKAKNAELSHLLKPVILTEGKTDALILQAAWAKLFPDDQPPFEIKSCDLGGTEGSMENAGADELKKILESTTKDQNPVRIGIFDCDPKGTECFSNLKKHNEIASLDDAKINRNRLSGALRLPSRKWGSPFDEYMLGNTSIEMMFPFDNIPKDSVDFEFWIGGKKLPPSKGHKWVESLNTSPDLYDDIPFKVVPKFDDKSKLSLKLCKLDAAEFASFKPVFKSLKAMLRLMGN